MTVADASPCGQVGCSYPQTESLSDRGRGFKSKLPDPSIVRKRCHRQPAQPGKPGPPRRERTGRSVTHVQSASPRNPSRSVPRASSPCSPRQGAGAKRRVRSSSTACPGTFRAEYAPDGPPSRPRTPPPPPLHRRVARNVPGRLWVPTERGFLRGGLVRSTVDHPRLIHASITWGRPESARWSIPRPRAPPVRQGRASLLAHATGHRPTY
jgi:hypothetical protein